MLERVRNSMQSGATYVLIAGLVVIFMFFFGMPSQTCSGAAGRQRAHLADVAGESIHTEDVNLLYNRVYGSNRTNEENQYRQRRAKSLRNLLFIELFADRAREAGFRVSTDELKNYITDAVRNIEYRYRYGQGGSFNGQYYKAYVQNRLRTQIEKYEQFKREELLARKYLAANAAQAAVPKAELERARTIKETELNLSFVALDNENVQNSIEVDDEVVQNFLENNRDEVESYYEENKSEEYSDPAQLRIRRVFISRPGSSDDESKRTAKEQKWKEAKTRVLEDDESVASVAKDLSEGYKSEQGGLMEWSSAENVDPSVRNALEGAEIGAVETVETERSYRLVQLEDRREAETTPLEEVETKIARKLVRQQRADEFISNIKTQLHEKARELGSLEKALEKLQSETDEPIWSDLSVQQTGAFTLEAQGPPPQLAAQMGGQMPAGMGSSWFEIPEIGASKELAIEAFKNLTEESPVAEDVYEVDGTQYVVRLASRSEPGGGQADDSDSSLEESLESKKLSQLVGRWTAIFGSLNGRFVPPMDEYGPWIDRQLAQAVENGTVELYPNRSRVAQILDQSFQPGGEPEPLKGLKGSSKGKQPRKAPIQLERGTKKGKKGKTKGKSGLQKLSPEKIEEIKKKLKNQKQKRGGGSDQSSGTGGPAESSE